jgi:UDP-glucose 4-epimerase
MASLVTGGAGFIGSHLVDFFMESGEEVHVLDNLSSGSLGNIDRWIDDTNFSLVIGDLLDVDAVSRAIRGCNTIYHMAANPEVRSSRASPQDLFNQNVLATFNLLEVIRLSGDVKSLIFASTSTVYGEPHVVPTPETYGPLKPISLYGASKLASEALISSYSNLYGFRCLLLRFANVVGSRSNHGVIYDFIQKLKADPRNLVVLGDGSQSKSYLHVSDCVEGIVKCSEESQDKCAIINMGSEDRVDVLSIANIVIEAMNLSDVAISLTGGVDGGRGWHGDVKLMQLDVGKAKSIGWNPLLNSYDAVKETAIQII